MHPQVTTKYLLQRRGDSVARRVVRARAAQNLIFHVSPKPVSQSAQANGHFEKSTITCAPRAMRSRTHSSKRAFKPRIHPFGFLSKALRALPEPRYTAASLQAEAALSRQDRHYREVQFYHNRPKLRLPQTPVTRSRRRKAGLVTFARNSLQPARSPLGQSLVFLPPVNAYSRATAKRAVGFASTATSLAAYENRNELSPIF